MVNDESRIETSKRLKCIPVVMVTNYGGGIISRWFGYSTPEQLLPVFGGGNFNVSLSDKFAQAYEIAKDFLLMKETKGRVCVCVRTGKVLQKNPAYKGRLA